MLGEIVRKIRRSKGLTQQQVADKLGIQQSDIHRIERGLVQNPHWFRVVEIAKALEVTLDELAGRDGT